MSSHSEIPLARPLGDIILMLYNNVFPYLQLFSSKVLYGRPVSPRNTNGCQTDMIYFAGDISLSHFNCRL